MKQRVHWDGDYVYVESSGGRMQLYPENFFALLDLMVIFKDTLTKIPKNHQKRIIVLETDIEI